MINKNNNAFTLIEVIVGMVILTMIASTVIVVMTRITNAVTNGQMKTAAFEIARENMENILSLTSVSDLLELGQSEIYPEINWTKRIESFYEPITNRMWMRAMCTAEYRDTEGKKQTVELQQWLSSLSKQQILQILDQKQKQKEYEQDIEIVAWLAELGQGQVAMIAEQLGLSSEYENSESIAEWVDGLSDEQIERIKAEKQKQITQFSGRVQDYTPQIDTTKPIEPAPEAEQENTDTNTDTDPLRELLGPPPEGYDNWSQVPMDLLWKRVMEFLNAN